MLIKTDVSVAIVIVFSLSSWTCGRMLD